MNSLIKKRAKERSLELEKAERAQQMAEALVVSAESKQAVNVHSYAPIPPSASSPTLSKIRSALGSPGMGALTGDGDASDHSKTEKGYILVAITLSFALHRCASGNGQCSGWKFARARSFRALGCPRSVKHYALQCRVEPRCAMLRCAAWRHLR